MSTLHLEIHVYLSMSLSYLSFDDIYIYVNKFQDAIVLLKNPTRIKTLIARTTLCNMSQKAKFRIRKLGNIKQPQNSSNDKHTVYSYIHIDIYIYGWLLYLYIYICVCVSFSTYSYVCFSLNI